MKHGFVFIENINNKFCFTENQDLASRFMVRFIEISLMLGWLYLLVCRPLLRNVSCFPCLDLLIFQIAFLHQAINSQLMVIIDTHNAVWEMPSFPKKRSSEVPINFAIKFWLNFSKLIIYSFGWKYIHFADKISIGLFYPINYDLIKFFCYFPLK